MASSTTHDLVIRAGRVVCPASGLDQHGAIGIRDGRIADVGSGDGWVAAECLDISDGIALPGLVDLHAHPAHSGSKYGVDPDVHMLPRGTTTVLSQGDAGASTWLEYRTSTIDASLERVRLAINLSARGESMQWGCLEDLADVDVDACVGAIRDGGEFI